MKFSDLSKLNALSLLLEKLKGLQRKHDYPRWHVHIEMKGSGWCDQATIEDEEFCRAIDQLIKEQQKRTKERITALGVKEAA